jgi:hypothetical protein
MVTHELDESVYLSDRVAMMTTGPDATLGEVVEIPLGGGGGSAPDLPSKAAQGASIPTRSAMENALYAVNFFTLTQGIGYAWIKDRKTSRSTCLFSSEARHLFARALQAPFETRQDFE